MNKSTKKLKNCTLPLTFTPPPITLKQVSNITFKIFKITYILLLAVIPIGYNIISIEINSATLSNPIIITLLILGFSIYVLLFNKEILGRLKMFGVTRRPCNLIHHFICPVIIFLLGFSLIFLIIEHHHFFNLPLILSTILILIIIAKSNIWSSLMGIFKILLTIFIYYFAIKNFYYVNLANIYKLLYSKSYISNMTMTGITSATYLTFNPLFSNFNFSIISYIEGNSISLITLQTNSWVLTPFIIFVGVLLLFSLLMFLNYKIYCKKVNKPKRILKKQKNKSLLMQLILLTIFKCIILGLVFCSIKQKYNLA